jgi:hypothetical protein
MAIQIVVLLIEPRTAAMPTGDWPPNTHTVAIAALRRGTRTLLLFLLHWYRMVEVVGRYP